MSFIASGFNRWLAISGLGPDKEEADKCNKEYKGIVRCYCHRWKFRLKAISQEITADVGFD